MLLKLRGTLWFMLAYVRLNLASGMEYRVSFLALAFGMILNDALMLVFWLLFFDRFPQVAGWGFHDVLLLWAIAATAFGVSTVFFGNAVRLASLIVQGQMDYYLSLPRNTLLHTLISRMSLSGWGDITFGVVAFIASGPTSAVTVALYILLGACAAATFTAFEVIAGTLAFIWATARQFSCKPRMR